jgi:hypothetical protein
MAVVCEEVIHPLPVHLRGSLHTFHACAHRTVGHLYVPPYQCFCDKGCRQCCLQALCVDSCSGVCFGLLVEMCTRQTCRAPSHWIARAEAPGSDLLPPNSLAEPDALAGSRRMYLSTTNRLAEACAESKQSEQDPSKRTLFDRLGFEAFMQSSLIYPDISSAPV